jgi:peptidoglycan/LPS O-acetylase OafA/YrhL
MPITLETGKRNQDLDMLRGFATLLILLLHNHITHKLNLFGQDRVELFFILSGFLVSSNLFKEIKRTGTFSIKQFYQRRALRIYPLLLFYILVNVLLEFININFLKNLPNLFGSLWENRIFGELLLIQNYLGFISGQTWSIAVIEHFNLIWPPLLLVFCSRKWLGTYKNHTLIAISYLAILCFCIVMRYYDFNWSFTNATWFVSGHASQSQNRIDSIAVGALLAYFSIYSEDSLRAIINKYAWLLIPLSYLLLASIVIIPREIYFQLAYPSRAFGFVLVVATIIYIPQYAKFIRTLLTPPLVQFLLFTARYSYALYLFHFLAFSNIEMIIKKFPFYGWQKDIFILIADFAGVYIIAYLVTKFFDAPIQKLRSHIK